MPPTRAWLGKISLLALLLWGGEFLRRNLWEPDEARYAYVARLKAVTPHTLRHTFGKNLVDAGVSLDRVAQLLGHESVDTTRIYTTPSAQDLQREAEKVALV